MKSSIRQLLPVLFLVTVLFVSGCGGGGGGGGGNLGDGPFRYDPGLPVAVTGIQAVPGDQVVTLSWTPVYVATSYNIYYAPQAAGGGVPSTGWTGMSVSGGTSTAIWGLTNRITYYFVVTAVNKNGEGEGAPNGQSAPPSPVAATPGPITQADLAATWYFHTIVCGPSAKWERGTVDFDASGNATFTDFLDSAHYNPVDNSSSAVALPSSIAVTVQGDGSLTMSGAGAWSADFKGTMGSRKNMWVATWTYSVDGSRALTIFQKKRATNDYTVWDVSGTGGQNPSNPNLAGNGPTRFSYHALNSGSSIEWEYSNARVGQIGQFWLDTSLVPSSSYLIPLDINLTSSSVKDIIYWDYSTPTYKTVEQYDLMWKVTCFGMRPDGFVTEYNNFYSLSDASHNVMSTGRMTDDKTVIVGVTTKNVIDSSQTSTGSMHAVPGQYFMKIVQLNFIPTDQSLPTYTVNDTAGTYKFHKIGAALDSGGVASASWARGRMQVSSAGRTTFPIYADSNSRSSISDAFVLSYYPDTGSDGNTWTTFANFVSTDTGDAYSRYNNNLGQPYYSNWTWWNALTNKTQSGSGVRQIPLSTHYYNEHATLSYNKDMIVMTRTDGFGYNLIVGLK
jgi:hypothetical protein